MAMPACFNITKIQCTAYYFHFSCQQGARYWASWVYELLQLAWAWVTLVRQKLTHQLGFVVVSPSPSFIQQWYFSPSIQTIHIISQAIHYPSSCSWRRRVIITQYENGKNNFDQGINCWLDEGILSTVLCLCVYIQLDSIEGLVTALAVHAL